MQEGPRLSLPSSQAALVCVLPAAAGVYAYTVRMTPADQAAARAVMLRQSEPSATPLSGRAAPRLPTSRRPCAAATSIPRSRISWSRARPRCAPPARARDAQRLGGLRSAKMVDLSWQRAASSPHYLSCVGSFAQRSLSAEEHFVSFRKLSVPKIGGHSEGYRTLVDVQTADGTVRLAIDTVIASRGRTQVSLTTMIRLTSVPKRGRGSSRRSGRSSAEPSRSGSA